MRIVQAKALSLIEVVAALVLLATTVTLLLAAHTKSLEQLRTLRDRELSDVLANKLIASWKTQPPDWTVPAEGSFPAQPSWRWQRRAEPRAWLETLLWEVTLTINKTNEFGLRHEVSLYVWLERISDGVPWK